MTKEEIIKEYNDQLRQIDTHNINEFKKWVERNEDIISIDVLTIACSIIAVFDILEKKEKN